MTTLHPSLSRPWAILEDWLRLMCAATPSAQASASAPRPSLSTAATAVILVEGPLLKRQSDDLWSLLFGGGGSSYEEIAEQFRAAIEDPNIARIVFAIDSPGGEVNGCAELADLIYSSRGKKPIEAFVQGYGASAAYWIASAADRVWCSSTSLLGSIGVRCSMVSFAKMDEMSGVKEYTIVSSQSPLKVLDPDAPEDRQRLQQQLTEIAAVFVAAVARGRGVSEADVVKRFGAGDCLVGESAVAAGLADGIATLEDVMVGSTAGPMASACGGHDMGIKCAKCAAEVPEDKPVYCENCVKPEGLVDDEAPVDDEEAKSAKAMVAELQTMTGKPSAEMIGTLVAWRDAAGKATELAARVAELEAEKRSAAFEALVQGGIEAGKLPPAMAKGEWIKTLRASADGAAQLRAYLDAAPVLLPSPAVPPAVAAVEVTDEDRRVAKLFGNNPEAVVASRNK